ncbi:SDR family NAD(P)-dependent oxidoreductase [Paenibacillus sp. G2S3]|uniref:SDR family NAD(P)-dependent oxidoreductase n=1 Tax=Paenibacillus sp. G2S3 TaxID=3047872 RepID=UPI0024C15DC5|nr:SDR family NAD(P)-dependent oxidoreductase [Paenibacillus sp. G2S3]WHY20682.1 SDR family NAD(P)-dependent oxidoreductase [Paenibacillus sp. G2S3]
MKKTIAILGAGPGLGLSIAKKFGANGFQVALISRNADKLNTLVEELRSLNIEAAAFPADVYNKEQVIAAFRDIKAKYGFIDVLEFSPTSGNYPPTPASQVTEENALDAFQALVVGAIRSVEQVLPEMLEKRSGALLFTTGLSSIYPMQMMGNVGIALSGLRNYALNLHADLSPQGIYVGHLALGVFIKPGTATDPGLIADAWYDMYVNKDKAEDTFPQGVTPATIIW